jgi:hypothetical protein
MATDTSRAEVGVNQHAGIISCCWIEKKELTRSGAGTESGASEW